MSDLTQRVADAKCAAYRIAYRIADALGLPTSAIRKRYVGAVRHANGLYWAKLGTSAANAERNLRALADASKR